MKFGQFESDGKNSDVRISKLPKDERRKSRTFVFINGKFKDGLKIQFATINKTVEIDGELYYYFFNSKAWKSKPYYPFKSLEKDFPLKEPEIIQIISQDIEHNINSGIFCTSLCQFTVKKSEIKKYIHREFNNHEFSDVLNNNITRFKIKFVDEKLNELYLTRGLPSWVQLVFSHKMENKHNVLISSEPTQLHPENDMSSFTVELKRTMDFSVTDDPKVALTRLSFKNKFKIMPGLKLNIFIYNFETNYSENFNCPRGNGGPRNCDDIIQWCKKLLEETISVKMEKKDNGNWSMNFPNKRHLIIIGRDLAQCLGISYLHRKSGDLLILI